MKRVALIGVGNMGKNHLRILQSMEDVEVVAISDTDISKANERNTFYTDYQNMLKEEDIEFLVIATNTPSHYAIALDAIDAGIKHILIEKPICEDYTDAKKLISLAKENDATIMIGHVERFNPVARKIKELVTDKEIDTIICSRNGLPDGRETDKLGIDLCIHDIDICGYLLEPSTYDLFYRRDKINSCNLFVKIGATDCFFHADIKSPYKKREIRIIGKDFIIEGDYIDQLVWFNGRILFKGDDEPLRLELVHFLEKNYTQEDLDMSVMALWVASK